MTLETQEKGTSVQGVPSPTYDFELIARTQTGETEAFSGLVHRYHTHLLRHITRRVTDEEVAKDLTQEVWLKAFRGIEGFQCKSTFTSWLYRIAKNVCIDFFRKRKDDTDPLHLIDEGRITDTETCPSRDIERAELRQQLREAIRELTPIRRRVFCLYYREEQPIKAIAKRLRRSEGTIETHLRNARRDLQAFLMPS